jgi:hypothetical protein
MLLNRYNNSNNNVMDLTNILFLPIDLPKLSLNREKVIEYFNLKKTPHQDWNWVNFKKYSQPIDPDLVKIFPYIEDCLRALPYADYDNSLHVDFREQVSYNKPHQDPIAKSLVDSSLGPTAYKNLVMRDKLESFYLLPKSTNPTVQNYDPRPLSALAPVFPIMPLETDWFVINNHVGYHGSLLLPSHYKKITMFFAGPIDENQHYDMIDRSIKKYQNYIIYN